MTVRDFLRAWSNYVSINVYQRSIKEISGNDYSLIFRQAGDVRTLLATNQNYLEFEVEYCKQDFDVIVIVCKANKEQEQKTIETYKGDYYG